MLSITRLPEVTNAILPVSPTARTTSTRIVIGMANPERQSLPSTRVIIRGRSPCLRPARSGCSDEDEADQEDWVENLGQNSVGNGNKRFQYDSCMVSSAMQSFGGLSVIDNAWMDNWPAS